MTTTKEEKSKVKYESEIITIPETFEKPLPKEQIPVFTLEQCEIVNSSIGSPAPKFGHNVQILLPQGTDFVMTDRAMRNNYLASAQKTNPNLEIIKGSLSAITNKDVLEGKFDEKYLNRTLINFNISNSYMFDRTVDENGKNVDKKITKQEEAKGEAIVKYFRVIDQFTGEGIDPEVFKYVNGEKVTSFVSPKTKKEIPFYLNRGDIVNIKIRPFGVKNKKTGELSLRYNILSIEIVQTAYERGGGKTGGSKRVSEAPDSVDANDLQSIFGGVTVVSQPTTTTTKTAPAKTEPAKAEAPTQTATAVAEKPAEEVTNEVPTLDFSALSNMDFSGANLGE